jgi:hypothetical protein
MLTHAAPLRAIRAVAVCAAVLAASAACGSASRAPGADAARLAATAGQPTGCRISMGTLPAAEGFPGFTEYQTLPGMRFPARPHPGSPPSPLQREYVCGDVAGFVTNISLTGKYRQQNNATARSLGYPIEKWPYTPLSGPIVGQQRHKALEIYVSVLQFTSAQAATSYADPPQLGPGVTAGMAFLLRQRPLHVLRLPGAVVFAQPLGTNPAGDEMDVTVRLPLRDFVIVLGLRGGESFGWADAAPYWNKVYATITPALRGKAS